MEDAMLKRTMGPLLLALALAGCGADGAPVTPGVTVSGEAQMGVEGTL
jgi:hypothetical protein